jgi:hypothetical protein
MKRIIILILVVVFSFSSLFANNFFDDDEFFNPQETHRPTSARVEAMGGAGLATASGADAFFINPANLASRKFSLNLPSVAVTVFNPKKIIDLPSFRDLIDGNDIEPEKFALDFITILNNGKGDILTTDITTSFTAGGFGLGVHIQEQLHNIDRDLDASLFAEINTSLSVGFGFNIKIVPRVLSLDIGAVVRPTYKAYTSGFDFSLITNFFDDSSNVDPLDMILEKTSLAAGYAVPFDVGVNLNLPIGFKVSLLAKNINGRYYMQKYEETGVWLNEVGEVIGTDIGYTPTNPDAITSFTIDVPFTMDLGIGWAPNLGSLGNLIRPSFAFDFVDIVGLAEEMDGMDDAIWNHLRAGVELKLFSMLDLRAGINRGAMSLGVGLDLFAIRLDAAYYWRELGVAIGDKPVDALTVRVNIGFDR